MDQKVYVIYAIYGEYDDHTEIPIFACMVKEEAELFVDALKGREQPYWGKVESHFLRARYGIEISELSNIADKKEAADMRKYCIPHDIGFSYWELDVSTLS